MALNISPHLVASTHANQILQVSSESEQEFFPSREQPSRRELFSSREQPSGSKPTQTRYEEERDQTTHKEETRQKMLSFFPELKKLEQFYIKGPASYGSIERLQTQSKLPMGKVQSNLETKLSFTKYRSIRLKFCKFKVFVKDINEIWSLDLARVDKLANYKRNIKYLLVAVDCLSRYIQAEPLKTKYATEAAEAFKKMIKIKQPKKVCVDDGTEFLEALKQLCTKLGIHLYSTYSEKSRLLQRGTLDHSKR